MQHIREIADAVASVGGVAYLVGGAVRDSILGRPSHDEDVVVTGLESTQLTEIFPNALQTGKAFPVWRVDDVEIALARTERKEGRGHNGFVCDFSSAVTIEEDLRRRDLTVNAIARNILAGELVDPFHGVDDAHAGVLREVDAESFKEDPLRVLRAARFASTLGFEPSASLLACMGDEALLSEVRELPAERIWGELEKVLASDDPEKFFRVLKSAGALSAVFPEIAALIGQTQPVEYHPEGDAFEHSLDVLSKVAAKTSDPVARFAGLFHDVGKGMTPKELLPRHYAHDDAGERILDGMRRRFPKRFCDVASLVAKWHMKPKSIKKALEQGIVPIKEPVGLLQAATRLRALDVLRLVCEADRSDCWWFDAASFVFGSLREDEIPRKGDIGSQVTAIRRERMRQWWWRNNRSANS